MIILNLNDIAFFKYQGGDGTSQNRTTILRQRGPVRRARYLHHHDRHDSHELRLALVSSNLQNYIFKQKSS